MNKLDRQQDVDVLLIAEGSYPYVSGGVSAWVDTLINQMPDINFGVVFLGASPDQYQGFHYKLPKNVIYFTEHFLFDYAQAKELSPPLTDVQLETLHDLHDSFTGCEHDKSIASQIYKMMPASDSCHHHKKNHISKQKTWQFIADNYQKKSGNPEFINYLWTIRNMHEPTWAAMRLLPKLPKAKLIHTISTGYAGFIAALLRQRDDNAMLLTEHGIYTKERRIDLLQSSITPEPRRLHQHQQVDYLRELWIRFFNTLARITYEQSNHICSLYCGAQASQEEDGANPSIQSVIPNGVAVEKFAPCRHKLNANKKRICLLGRVVPIKDTKNFIYAVKVLEDAKQDIEAWITGSMAEDQEYVLECKKLVKTLKLENKIIFTGEKAVTEVYPQIDLVVLSSISEAMPLVVLESMASGVPCVTTDVGSCRELIYGVTEADKKLGASGYVVPTAAAEELAKGIINMLDPLAWEAASQAGISRVLKFYTLEKMIEKYRDLYVSLSSAKQD